MISIDSILHIECIKNNIFCNSKYKILKIISKIAEKKINLSYKIIFSAILNREYMGSTGIGSGVAIPHGRIKEKINTTMVGIFIKLNQPIAFDSIDNQPVDLLFTLLMPKKFCKIHLYMLSTIINKLTNKILCKKLRSARNEKELYEIIIEKNGSPY